MTQRLREVATRLRPAGWGHGAFAVATVVVWVHLLDASIVHPQRSANIFEHACQVVAALTLPPLTVGIYPALSRLQRGVMALVVGSVAVAAGATIHIVGVIKNSEWQRSDFTGVAMAFAGLSLLLLATTLLTLAIRRKRFRLLMVVAVPAFLAYGLLPLGVAVYVTHAPRYVITAQDLGAPYEEVRFETADGKSLVGWYVPSRNGAAVAVMHGSGGARIRPIDHGRMLVRNGYGVLMFDSRGHGESDGPTNALGWHTYEDAIAAAKFLEARHDVEPGRVGVLGVSMGAEIAIEAAAHADTFAAIVADGASGRTLADTLDSSPGNGFILGYPFAGALQLWEIALSRTTPAPALADLTPRVREPVLYIASGTGPEPTLVTKIAGRSAGDHELWLIPDAGHTQGIKQHPEEYEERVIGFFQRYLLESRE